jgi:hypothetical protein
MSAGTREFWVVDPQERTVQVTDGGGSIMCGAGDTVPVSLFESVVSVEDVFKI